jgi:hypothetical protein
MLADLGLSGKKMVQGNMETDKSTVDKNIIQKIQGESLKN